MNLHPSTTYAVHQAERREVEARLRDRRAAAEARMASQSNTGSTPSLTIVRLGRLGVRRGTAVAAATGVLVLTALTTLS